MDSIPLNQSSTSWPTEDIFSGTVSPSADTMCVMISLSNYKAFIFSKHLRKCGWINEIVFDVERISNNSSFDRKKKRVN